MRIDPACESDRHEQLFPRLIHSSCTCIASRRCSRAFSLFAMRQLSVIVRTTLLYSDLSVML